MRQKLKMPLIAVCLCLTGAGTANAQWVVSDPGNLAQSIINSAKEMVESTPPRRWWKRRARRRTP